MSSRGAQANVVTELRRMVGDMQKSAAVNKQAEEPLTEPGSISGASSHPTAKVDDGTQKPSEGERSSENTADVKDAIPGTSVDAAPESGLTPTQDTQQLGIGLRQSETGGDPAVEDDYKGDKDDGQIGGDTTHPANADDTGEKYSSWSLSKIASTIGTLGNSILADMAKNKGGTKAAAAVTTPAAPAAPAKPAATTPEQAAQAGYELAKLAGMQDMTDDDMGREFLQATIKEACFAAAETAQFLRGYHEGRTKQAGDGDSATEAEDHSSPDDSGSGGPPQSASEGAGEGAAPAGDPGMMGAGAPADPMGGGDMGGGMPPDPGMGGGAPGAPGAGGPPQEEVLHQLLSALAEMGITPEMLLQAAQTKAAAAKNPLPKATLDTVKNAVANAQAYRRTGKWGFGPTRNAKEAQLRAQMRQTISEIVN